MLDDRSYMRENPGREGGWLTGMWILVIVNVVCFILQESVRVFTTQLDIDPFLVSSPLALSVDGLKAGKVWQLFTFQFLHSDVWHLVVNCLGIYFFGRWIEEELGRNRLFAIYFSSGTLGGCLQIAGGLIFPGWIGESAVVGASAGAFGLISAFVMMNPQKELTLLLLPVQIKAWVMLAFSAAFAVLFLLFGKDNVAHLAHLGGMLGGIGFILAMKNGIRLPEFAWNRSGKRDRARQLVATANTEAKTWSKTPAAEEISSEEYISREVDPILDKISAHGIHSLDERERKVLEAARRRMSGR